MTKKDFETALDRSIEAMLDGGQPGIDDVLLISKALGGADLELMSKDERDTFLFGAHAGYKLGIGERCQEVNMDNNQIGKKLKYLRNNSGKTQKEVAQFLGITRPAYTLYETGVNVPPRENLEKLASFFNVPLDYFTA